MIPHLHDTYSFCRLLTALCFILQLTICLIRSNFDDYVQCGGDHWEYQSLAVNLVEGHGFMLAGGVSPFETYRFRKHNTQPFALTEDEFYSSRKQSFFRSPVYPLFLAGVYKAVGIRPIAVKSIQLGLFCLGACLLIPVGWIAAGKPGLLAGFLTSWVFVFSFYGICTELYSEPFLSFIGSLLLLAWVLVLKKETITRSILLGLVLGVAVLSKGTFYLPSVFILGYLIYRYVKLPITSRLHTLTATVFVVFITVMPYVLWQNQFNLLRSDIVFISQDGPAAIIGGNNEFATDGNWVGIPESTSYYSSLPSEMGAVFKVFNYYFEFPERIIPNVYYKLRNSLMRAVPGSVLVYACISFLLFYVFKSIVVRIVVLTGGSGYLVINFLSANYLHYRYIENSFLFVFIILSLFVAGLIGLMIKNRTNQIFVVVFPFVFPLFLLTLVLYGHHRIVMPFYLASLLLGFWVLIMLLNDVLKSAPVSQQLGRIRRTDRRICFNYAVLLIIPWVIPFVICESYLRLDGGLDTYAEKTGNSYRSYYNQEPPSLYWNHPMNTTYTIDQGDFVYEYETNELGLREKLNAISFPDTSIFRVLTLGDSFTEGFGTSADSAWPKVFERRLGIKASGSVNLRVYNAGMAGSDPFFNYRMLKDKLAPFRPNLVIQTINTSDLSDYLFRGGMGRFRSNKVVFRKGPWWEPIYRFSYTFRLLVHSTTDCDFMLVTHETKTRIYEEAILEYLSLFAQDYNDLAKELGFSVVFVLQPMPSDLRYAGYDYRALIKLDSALRQKHMVSIDLLKPMLSSIGKDSTYRFSWRVDGHYNGLGYEVMGNILADSVAKMLPEIRFPPNDEKPEFFLVTQPSDCQIPSSSVDLLAP